MTETFIPPIPSPTESVSIRREALELLAFVDLTRTGRRVLDVLMAHASPETGVAVITQREMAGLLGCSLPSVNRGFRELREAGVAWPLDQVGRYQLHPLLTGGAVNELQAVPEIKVVNPAQFTAERLRRYTTQAGNLVARTA